MASKWHPLHTAAISGNLETVLQEYKKGVVKDPNILNFKDANGCSVIHFATLSGNPKLVRELIKLGCDVNSLSRKMGGISPLVISTMKGHIEVTNILLESGADPSIARKNDGWTPLHICAFDNNPNMAVLFLSNPSLIDIQDAEKRTCIHVAVEQRSRQFIHAIERKYPRYRHVVNGLLSRWKEEQHRARGAILPTSLTDPPGGCHTQCQSPLRPPRAPFSVSAMFDAARSGDCDTLKAVFAEHPAGVNTTFRNGWTLLMEAAAVGNHQVIKVLLEMGCATEARNKRGLTALHVAVRHGYLQATRALLDAGACPDVVTPRGDTIEEIAVANGHHTLMAFLVQRRSRALENNAESASSESCTPTNLIQAPPHETLPSDKINLDTWLESWRLTQYKDVLAKNGFDTLCTLGLLSNEDLESMGFLLLHRKVFALGLDDVRKKYPQQFQCKSRSIHLVEEPVKSKKNKNRNRKKRRSRHKNKKSDSHVTLPELSRDISQLTTASEWEEESEGSGDAVGVYASAGLLISREPSDNITEPSSHSTSPISSVTYMQEQEDWMDGTIDFSGTSATGAGPAVKELKFDEIELGPVIGEGSFGSVRSGYWRGMNVAVKTLRPLVKSNDPGSGKDTSCETHGSGDECPNVRELRHEASTMARVCNHAFVIQFVGIVLEPLPSVVTVFCGYGSVEDLLVKSGKGSTFDADILFRLATEAAMGIRHLHLEGVIHRDLAARNLLIDDNFHIRVADFGFARVKEEAFSKGYTRSDMGPIRWSAPEAMRNNQYSESSDVFSFGVVLYEMFVQRLPWEGYETLDVAIRVCSEERMQIPAELHQGVADLMRSCWAHLSENRPLLDVVINELRRMRQELTPELLRKDANVVDNDLTEEEYWTQSDSHSYEDIENLSLEDNFRTSYDDDTRYTSMMISK